MPTNAYIASLTPSHFILRCGGKSTWHDNHLLVPVVRDAGYEWQAPKCYVGEYVIHHAMPEMARIVGIDDRLVRLSFGVSSGVVIRLAEFTYPEFTSCILVPKGCNYETI